MNYQSLITIKKRIAIMLLVASLLMIFLVLRVTYIQVFMASKLKQGAEEQRFRSVSILPRRGTIYDRQGYELAVSIDAESVFAIPKEVGIEETVVNNRGRNVSYINKSQPQKVKIAKLLAETLSLDTGRIETAINKNTSFVWIKRKANFEEIQLLRQLIKEEKIRGIEISQNPRRFYPQNKLAKEIA